jgi:uncharacterized protein
MTKLNRRAKRILIVLVVTYFIGGVVLYFAQDFILFHPTPLGRNHQFRFEQVFEETNISQGKNNLSIVKFKTSRKRKGIVLFYHGNMENIEHYKSYPAIFLSNNYDVWMIDYPGFGKTTGKRTENIINEQAILMYDMSLKQTSSDSIIIYGKSIGTGVAAFVASERNCKHLVLETPYYSIPDLARHYLPVYPVKWMIQYSFPTHQYLLKVQSPITIFHGTKDEVIPYSHSARLKDQNKKIKLVTIANGKHNNLTDFKEYHTAIDSLLGH